MKKYNGYLVVSFYNNFRGIQGSNLLKEKLTKINFNSLSNTLISNFGADVCTDLNSALTTNKDKLKANYEYANTAYLQHIEKNKIILKYKQKLNEIKQRYGVKSSIKNITFVNLKYKNTFSNLSIIYNGETRNFDYMNYEFTEAKNVRNVSHKKMLPILEKEYKLKLLVAEIERANSEYINKLNDIDVALKQAPKYNQKF